MLNFQLALWIRPDFSYGKVPMQPLYTTLVRNKILSVKLHRESNFPIYYILGVDAETRSTGKDEWKLDCLS